MDIVKYLERVTVIFNPDGTVRGSEAHEHTGYLEERAVPDAPGTSQLVFVVVKPEVRAIAAGDLAAALDGGCPAIEDAAAKAGVIAHLQDLLESTGAELERIEGIVADQADTIADQAMAISEREAALGEASKREAELRIIVQRLTAELANAAPAAAA